MDADSVRGRWKEREIERERVYPGDVLLVERPSHMQQTASLSVWFIPSALCVCVYVCETRGFNSSLWLMGGVPSCGVTNCSTRHLPEQLHIPGSVSKVNLCSLQFCLLSHILTPDHCADIVNTIAENQPPAHCIICVDSVAALRKCVGKAGVSNPNQSNRTQKVWQWWIHCVTSLQAVPGMVKKNTILVSRTVLTF